MPKVNLNTSAPYLCGLERHKNLEEKVFDLQYQLQNEKEKNQELTRKQRGVTFDVSELKESKFLPDDFEIIEQDVEVSW